MLYASSTIPRIGGLDAAAASSRRPFKSLPMLIPMPSILSTFRPHLLSLQASFGPSRASNISKTSTRTRSSSGMTDPSSRDDRRPRNDTASRPSRKPRLRALVVVEGPSDARAVLRAVDLDPGCHSLGGATRARNKNAMEDLGKRVADECCSSSKNESGAAVILLLDPDAPGRVARGEISRELARRASSSPSGGPPSFSLYHAFIPPSKCRALRDVGGKSAGDTGIEHAPAEAVVAALRAARRHRGEEGRSASSPSPAAPPPLFSMKELEAARLATSFDAGSQQGKKKRTEKKESEGGEGTTTTTTTTTASSSQKTSDRRRRFCDALGLGPCTGAQLLRALNEWGLTREDWETGMRAAEEAEGEEGEGGQGE